MTKLQLEIFIENELKNETKSCDMKRRTIIKEVDKYIVEEVEKQCDNFICGRSISGCRTEIKNIIQKCMRRRYFTIELFQEDLNYRIKQFLEKT